MKRMFIHSLLVWFFVLFSASVYSQDYSRLTKKSLDIASEIATINAAALAYYKDNNDKWPSSLDNLSDDGLYIVSNGLSAVGTPYNISVNGINLELTVELVDPKLAQLTANQLANSSVINATVVANFKPPFQVNGYEDFLPRKADPNDPSKMMLETNIIGGDQEITNVGGVSGDQLRVKNAKLDNVTGKEIRTRTVELGSEAITETSGVLSLGRNGVQINGEVNIDGNVSLTNNDINSIAKLYAQNISSDKAQLKSAEITKIVGEYIEYKDAHINRASGEDVSFQRSDFGVLNGDTGSSGSVESELIIGETANFERVFSEELITTIFQSDSAETIRLSVTGLASVLNAVMESLNALDVNAQEWITERLNSTSYYSTNFKVTDDLNVSDRADIAKLVTQMLTSENMSVESGVAATGEVNDLTAAEVNALYLILEKLVTDSISAVSSELKSVTASRVAVDKLLSASSVFAKRGDFDELVVGGRVSGQRLTVGKITARRFDGGLYAGDDFDIGKTSENEIYNEITEYNNKLYNCMYVTKYCAATAPVIKNTACENCFRKDTISVFNGRAIAKVTECKNGCEYNWIIGNVSGNCSAGSIAKGSTRTVSCEFSKALSEGEKSNTQVTLIARNSMDASKLDKANFQISWERPQPQNPFGDVDLKPFCSEGTPEVLNDKSHRCISDGLGQASVRFTEHPYPIDEYRYSITVTRSGPAYECVASSLGSVDYPGISVQSSNLKVNRCGGTGYIVWEHIPTGETLTYTVEVQ